MESPVANKVTSQPRATSPSAMLPATVSQAPYCRGGVRQATGDRTATLFPGINILMTCGSAFRTHGSQYLFKRDSREAGSMVGQTIRNDQLTVMEQSAARIDHVGHVAFPFPLVGFEQRLAEAPDHFGGIVAIEQERADAVLSHGADPVAEDQPARIGLNGGSAVPKLDQLPRENRFQKHRALVPEVDVVGIHKIDILVVLAGEHGKEAFDFPGEQGHTFVFRGRSIQGSEPEQKKVGSIHQLRHHYLAIVGGEGGVIDLSAIVVLETDEAGVFDAVPLRGGGWKKNAFGQPLFGLELDLEVRPGQEPDTLCGA